MSKHTVCVKSTFVIEVDGKEIAEDTKVVFLDAKGQVEVFATTYEDLKNGFFDHFFWDESTPKVRFLDFDVYLKGEE